MFRCRLVERQGAWRLAYNGLEVGPYNDRVHAMEAATRLAGQVSRQGGETEIVLQPSPSSAAITPIRPDRTT